MNCGAAAQYSNLQQFVVLSQAGDDVMWYDLQWATDCEQCARGFGSGGFEILV
jgi:hypothetical protein